MLFLQEIVNLVEAKDSNLYVQVSAPVLVIGKIKFWFPLVPQNKIINRVFAFETSIECEAFHK